MGQGVFLTAIQHHLCFYFLFFLTVCVTETESGLGLCTKIEIHLDSLTVCLSLPYLPDGRGLWSGTAVAQSIRQPSLKTHVRILECGVVFCLLQILIVCYRLCSLTG